MCDGYRCRLRVTRAAMLATVMSLLLTKSLYIYQTGQYYLRYHEFTMKTKKTEIHVNGYFCDNNDNKIK